MTNQGYLVLESGRIFKGRFHSSVEKAGEVVFNTSHSGYEEMATDPSYYNQILVLTAPMQGNYGVDDKVWESRQLWISGFICLEVYDPQKKGEWKRRLEDARVPLLDQVDTRSLVIHLRSQGTTWGAIVQAASEEEAEKKAALLIQEAKKGNSDWTQATTRSEKQVYPGQNKNGPKVVVLDFGCKQNILRELIQRSREVVVLPALSTTEQLLSEKPQGILLSNGPGDPDLVEAACESIQPLIGQIPLFGICMGHQILSLALGGRTFKLKFGHRGGNHPIRDELTKQVYVTSQNHGYAVDPESLPKDVQITHWNLYDKTVAGIFSEKLKCMAVQFHPESRPGPHDASYLFDTFLRQIQ